MGTLEVRGSASKTVSYDTMRLELAFHAKEKTVKELITFCRHRDMLNSMKQVRVLIRLV